MTKGKKEKIGLDKQKVLVHEQPLFLDKEEKNKLFVEKIKKTGLFFELFDWAIIVIYIFFFLKMAPFRWDLFFMLMPIVALAQTLVYHRVFFRDLSSKDPKLALNIDISFLLLIGLFLVQQVGGVASPIIFLYVIILAVAAFVFNPYAVFALLFIEYLFIYLSSTLDPRAIEFVSSYYDLFFWEIIFLSLSAILYFVLSSFYFAEKKFHNKLEYFSNQLVADKVKSEAVLESMSDGVFVVNRERKVIFINEAAHNFIDISYKDKDRVMNHFYGSIFKLMVEGKPIDFDDGCPLELAMSEGKANFRRDYELPSYKDHLDIAMSSAPIIDASGNVQGAVAVMRDITKEKEIEKLQGEFISIASHELLTPITQVQGHLSMLVDEHIGKLDETADKLVGNAYGGIKRIARLVKDLMNVSHIERGTMKMHMQKTDIVAYLDQIVKDFVPQVELAGLKIVLDKPSKKVSEVLVDPDRLNEIINNLIGNAIKFTPKGQITVGVSEKKDGTVAISVSDTGVGIPKQEIPNLFQKFYQVDSSATREAEGTGLGLYISQKMIEMMSGKIWVESALGKGTTFYFSLQKAGKEVKE